MSKITPVLLAGGSGSRLWPLSRKSYPKQFSDLIGNRTLFQQSALRLVSSNIVDFTQHIILTNSDFRFIVTEQLLEVGIDPGPILIEPDAKNTAPAILAASLFAFWKDENAVLLVAPTDHLISDDKYFHKVIEIGLGHVSSGKLVTFGISPTRPETGYGYLECCGDEVNGFFDVSSFVEKPNLAVAKEMLRAGHFLWNSGIFMFRASDLIAEFEKFLPNMLSSTREAVQKAETDLGFLRFASEPWADLQNISIDFAIMEKSKNLVAIPFASGWSDLGDWDAVWSTSVKGEDGVAQSDNAHAIACKNTLLRSESRSQQIVGLGLEDIIAVAMPDAVLISKKDRSQEVKQVVELLKAKSIDQAEIFPKDHRPWGWYESLALNDHFQVKRILVNPGAALSLQSHRYRSEHWIVVEGTAKVTVDGETKLITKGESTYIPLGAVHRMENPGEIPMILIEVQTGSYLGEDDIIRYEDLYARN